MHAPSRMRKDVVEDPWSWNTKESKEILSLTQLVNSTVSFAHSIR